MQRDQGPHPYAAYTHFAISDAEAWWSSDDSSYNPEAPPCDSTLVGLVEGEDGEPLDIGRKTRSETKLDALVTLCGFHHRLVHEGGYGLRRTDDGLLVFTRPDGKRVENNGAQCFRGNISPPAGDVGFEDSLRDYLRKHEPRLSITAATSRCQWRGETMDYSQAIEAMQVLERVSAVVAP